MGGKRMIAILIIGSIVLGWIILTFLAQRKGAEKLFKVDGQANPKIALIVYNPDLFYNLDERVCKAFAKGLSEHGWEVQVATVATAEQLKRGSYDLYVFCVNTYNWAPDMPTLAFIKTSDGLKRRPAVAITLGSGSTARAKRILEETIKERRGNLIGSKEYWLMRPNDESKTNKSNVVVATEKAFEFAHKIALKIEQDELLLRTKTE